MTGDFPSSDGVLVVCGLEAEARIMRAGGCASTILVGGGDQLRLAEQLARLVPHARAVCSFGIAGGLADGLAPGDVVIADAVIDPRGTRTMADRGWAQALAARLPFATVATLAGADAPVTAVADKATLRDRTGAAIVDMETHLAATAAVAAGCPFAALRVVTDPARRALPHAAAVGMRPDGDIDLLAIMRSLRADPRQLPQLIATGLDARRAFAALLRCRQLLGPDLAFVDLD